MKKYVIALIVMMMFSCYLSAASTTYALYSENNYILIFHRIFAFLVPLVCALVIFIEIETKRVSVFFSFAIIFHMCWIIATAFILKGCVDYGSITIALELFYTNKEIII